MLTRVVITVALLFPLAAEADIYNCAGRWTNIPCSGEPTQTLDEVTSSPEPAAASGREVDSLLHDLRMRSIRFRDETGVAADVSHVERECQRNTSTLAQCETLIRQATNELEKKELEYKALSVKATGASDANSKTGDTNTTVIIERPVVIFDGHYRPRYPHAGVHHRRERSHSGAGVHISGTASDTRIGVSGSTSVTSGSYDHREHYIGRPGAVQSSNSRADRNGSLNSGETIDGRSPGKRRGVDTRRSDIGQRGQSDSGNRRSGDAPRSGAGYLGGDPRSR